MRQGIGGYARVIGACCLALCLAAVLAAQTTGLGELRNQLRAQYDIVALQGGVAFVPRQPHADVRLIEVRDGDVLINGEEVSAHELRGRLGRDADLILRVTYLDPAALRELAGAASTANGASPEPSEQTNQSEAVPVEPTETHSGDLVRFGGTITVNPGELVQGDVVVIGGLADIEGEVTGDVTVVGGSLNLGPQALVHRDANVVGGSLTRAPGARIYGQVNEVGVGQRRGFGPRFGRTFGRAIGRNFLFSSPFARVGRLTAALMQMSLLILGGLVVVIFGRRFVDNVAQRAASEPFRSGLTGLLTELLFVPFFVITVVALVVSIIGIPLLILVPFAVVLAIVFMFIGFTAVACRLGRFVTNRFGIDRGPYVSVILGVVLIFAITLLARIIGLVGGFAVGFGIAGALAAVGFLVEYIAWTMGVGAIILTWLGGRQRGTPAAPIGATPSPGGEAHAG